jgi:arsenate reductase
VWLKSAWPRLALIGYVTSVCMAMRVYTYKNCDSCKKATKWLSQQGIAFEQVAIRDTPPSVAELRKMLGYQAGELRKLFNTAGGDYRELKMKDKLPCMAGDDALELLASRGNLVKRPFLLADDFGLVGFKEVDWASAFSR